MSHPLGFLPGRCKQGGHAIDPVKLVYLDNVVFWIRAVLERDPGNQTLKEMESQALAEREKEEYGKTKEGR